MSEAGEQDYKFTWEDGTVKTTSRDYTGKATARYANGDSYEGEFCEGIRDGYGIYTYENGLVYEGDFKGNLKHGIGKLTYGRKGVYNGYFESGKRHGEGVFIYPNGDSYSGWWKDGLKHGKGTYVYGATGMQIRAEWREGKITQGKWQLPNGVFLHGAFDLNKPNGLGKWQFPNGNIVCGDYKQAAKEDEDAGGDEEEEPRGPGITVSWAPHTHLYESAIRLNQVVS